MIEYLCPVCKAEMSSPESMAGESEKCPTCRSAITVPAEPTVTRFIEPPQQQSAKVISPLKPCFAEAYCSLIGIIMIALGVIVGVVMILMASNGNRPGSAVSGVIVIASALGGAIPFFAISSALRYLRLITNAVRSPSRI